MIVLTRLNGLPFALNPDLIERADANPDTVVTLVGGTKYVVAESIDDLLGRVREFRGQIIATAHAFECAPPRERNLRVIPTPDDDAGRRNTKEI
jgi:flagellar protein FlbD